MAVSVKVFLDDNVPEYMSGIIRCGSVVKEYESGKEVDCPELIDNTEFHSEEGLIKDVAKRLRVAVDLVKIIK